MSGLNDSSSIKLFGKMMTLNQDESFERNLLSSSNSFGSVDSNHIGVQSQLPMEDHQGKLEEDDDDDNSGIPFSERKASSFESSKNEEENGSEQESLKKPDKILPCPRCNSKETKFCYYNNYNVNQPRHFCKNCQRYWTAGGAMRNMPVGAGRRKTKSSYSSYSHHVMITEAILGAQAINAVNGVQRTENNNSCVLTFGSDSSLFNLSHFPTPSPPPPPTALYRPDFPAAFYSSPALGKHPRDHENGNLKPSNSKALRIDDSEIEAKSSMMATLMIKTKNTMNSGGIFNGFQSKISCDDDDDNRNYRMRTFSMLQANPVALSRSLNFHENT